MMSFPAAPLCYWLDLAYCTLKICSAHLFHIEESPICRRELIVGGAYLDRRLVEMRESDQSKTAKRCITHLATWSAASRFALLARCLLVIRSNLLFHFSRRATLLGLLGCRRSCGRYSLVASSVRKLHRKLPTPNSKSNSRGVQWLLLRECHQRARRNHPECSSPCLLECWG